MQTFITYRSFEDTAKSLDNKRLGKQRLEATQILKCLEWYNSDRTDKAPSYRRHPGILQWVGYDIALKHYLKAMCDEWISRGFKNTIDTEISNDDPVFPWWFGEEYFPSFIKTHRNRLMQKDLDYYAEDKTLAWKHISADYKINDIVKTTFDPNLDYYWPVRIDKTNGRVARWNPNGTIINYIVGI